MRIKTQILLLLLAVSELLMAQHTLKKELNSPRSGDEFTKTEMNFFLVEDGNNKDPEKKEKKVWNLQKLKEKEKKKTYNLKIKTGKEVKESIVEEVQPDHTVTHFGGEKESIFSKENNTLYLRYFSGDSLLESGYEETRGRVVYSKPLLVIKFPMDPGEEYKSEFTGRGTKDDRLGSIHLGITTSVIDEFGELVLPSGDTLTSIVRVHEKKEEQIWYESLNGLFDINVPVNRDSLEKIGTPTDKILTDVYRWYEEGYRYPVFEVEQSYRILKDNTIPLIETTYVYAPYKQEFLREDSENEKIKKGKKNKKGQGKDNENHGDEIYPITYSFYPNPVKEVLNMRFNTRKGAETIVSLFELSGREVLRKVYPAENGYRSETIQVGAYPVGSYILRISCGEKYEAERIVKQ